MEELHGIYLTSAEAAGVMKKSENLVAQMCQRGKIPGVKKFGKSWLIPIDSAQNYNPDRRGPKPKKEKLAAELAGIRAEIAETAKGEASA